MSTYKKKPLGKGGRRPGGGRKADPAKAGRVMLSIEVTPLARASFEEGRAAAGLTQSAYFAACVEARRHADACAKIIDGWGMPACQPLQFKKNTSQAVATHHETN